MVCCLAECGKLSQGCEGVSACLGWGGCGILPHPGDRRSMLWSSLMKYPISFCVLALMAFESVGADRMVSGSATIDYTSSAWESLAADLGVPKPSHVLEAFFDQDASNARTLNALMSDPSDNVSYSPQIYGMNGAVVQNLEERTTQPTTFVFTSGKVQEHSGRIGLGGVSRFAFSGGGRLLFGDFTLQYDTSRLFAGGTGWYIQANIPPVAPLFDLLDVTVADSAGSLSIEGELGLSFEVANFLYFTPADTLRHMGHFRFKGITAPVVDPQPAVVSLSLTDGQLILGGRQGTPGASYTVEASERLSTPVADWSRVASGTFDVDGTFSVRVPMDIANRVQFFHVSTP